MKRLAAGLLALGALLAACSELGNGAGQISQHIGEVTRNPAARELDLAQHTSFGWQYFMTFKAGTTREEICRQVGAGRQHCGRVFRYTQVPPEHIALLFGQGGRLTHTELHPLAHGEFVLPEPQQGLPKAQAVFNIRRTATGPGAERVVLEPR